MTRISDRIERLRSRRTDMATGQLVLKEARLAKSHSETIEDARDYINEAMEEVPSTYTQNTFKQCARVENQLEGAFSRKGLAIDFAYQGSVTNNTHIRFYSDIDLLVLPQWFHCVEAPLTPTRPYQGSPLDDLLFVRDLCESTLSDKYPAADVGVRGSKSVSISGGSLRRKIDVVPSNWLDTQKYRETGLSAYRGIEILDTNGPRKLKNFPFLHNALINIKDENTNGNLRRLIRFLKSVRSDSDGKVEISSYDICGLCYAMANQVLLQAQDDSIALVVEFLKFAGSLIKNKEIQSNLHVPNRTRLLFGENGLNDLSLLYLMQEVLDVLNGAV